MFDQALSDAEFDELDGLLLSADTPESCMDISMLDGFLSALLIGPNTLLPSRWLPEVWGDASTDFTNQAKAQRILELIMRHYNDRAGDLAEGVDLYDPAIYSREVEGKAVAIIDEWCTGFMRGVMLDAEAWDPLFQSQEDAALLTPMILYGTESGQQQLAENPALQARHQNIADAIGVCVIGIRDHWLPFRKTASTFRRASDKVGRNDLCPCGSGKKFKKCCGSPEKLH